MKILKFLIPLFLFVSVGYGQFVAPRSSVWSFPLQPPTDTVRSGSYTDTSTSNYGINGIALRTERWLTYFLNNPVAAVLQNLGEINFTNGQTIVATTAGRLDFNTRANFKAGLTAGEASVTDGNFRLLSAGGSSYISLNPAATLTGIRTIYFPDTPGTVLVRTGTFLSSNNGTVNVDSVNLVTLGRWQTQTPTLANSFLQTAFGTGWATLGASKMAFNNGAIINTSGGGLSVNVLTDHLASIRVGNPAITLGFVDIYNAVNYQKFRLTTTTLTADRSATFGDTSGTVPLHVYPPLYQTANGNIWLDTTNLGGGGGGGGANTALSNVAATSIGADLIPVSLGYGGQYSLGANATPWAYLRSNYLSLVNLSSGKLTIFSPPASQANAANNISVGDTSGTLALTGTNGFSISAKGVGTIDTTSTISSKWYAREYYVAYLRSGASVDTVQYTISGMTTSGIVMVGFQDTRASGSPVWECRNGSVWIKSTYHGEPDSVKTIIHVLAK